MTILPFEQLRSAVYQRVLEVGGFPLYPYTAPQDTPAPYTVISRVSFSSDQGDFPRLEGQVTIELYDDIKEAPRLSDRVNEIVSALIAPRRLLELTDGFRDIGITGIEESAVHPLYLDGGPILTATLRISFAISSPPLAAL